MASTEILKQKAEQVEEIKSKISNAKSVVLINYSGLTVAQDTALRKAMREAGVNYSLDILILMKLSMDQQLLLSQIRIQLHLQKSYKLKLKSSIRWKSSADY